VAQGVAVVLHFDRFSAHLISGGVVGDGFKACGPVAQEFEGFAGEGLDGVVVALAEGAEGAVDGKRGGAVVVAFGRSDGSRDAFGGTLGWHGGRDWRRSYQRTSCGGGGNVGGLVKIEGLGQFVVAEVAQGLPVALGAVGGFGLLVDAGVDRPALFGDLGEVADAGAGDQDGGAGFLEGGVEVRGPVEGADDRVVALGRSDGSRDAFRRRVRGRDFRRSYQGTDRRLAEVQFFAQEAAQVGEHPADAGVVELACDRGIDRDILVLGLERDAIALPLFADVAQGVFGAAFVVFVEHD